MLREHHLLGLKRLSLRFGSAEPGAADSESSESACLFAVAAASCDRAVAAPAGHDAAVAAGFAAESSARTASASEELDAGWCYAVAVLAAEGPAAAAVAVVVSAEHDAAAAGQLAAVASDHVAVADAAH